jgi:NADH-quinone oxidoreductase subunit K
MLMSVELMLNAVNLAFAGFAKAVAAHVAQVLVLMVYVVAAVEVAVGMAIVVNMFRVKDTVNVDAFSAMKG